MVTRIPPHEIAEAAAWMAGPFFLLLLVFWAIAARRTRKRANRFAQETTRIDDQARAERQAAWREANRG